MSRPDEIMAQYLLKGGKMLAEACPLCHNPLFEYNGKRQCVICHETETVQENTLEKQTKKRSTSLPHSDPLQGQNLHTDGTVEQAAYLALLHTLSCIPQEDDAHSIHELSTSSAMLTKIYLKLIDLQPRS